MRQRKGTSSLLGYLDSHHRLRSHCHEVSCQGRHLRRAATRLHDFQDHCVLSHPCLPSRERLDHERTHRLWIWNLPFRPRKKSQEVYACCEQWWSCSRGFFLPGAERVYLIFCHLGGHQSERVFLYCYLGGHQSERVFLFCCWEVKFERVFLFCCWEVKFWCWQQWLQGTPKWMTWTYVVLRSFFFYYKFQLSSLLKYARKLAL